MPFTRTKLIDLNVKKKRLRRADVRGEEAFEATAPFPVRVVPADLVSWPPVT